MLKKKILFQISSVFLLLAILLGYVLFKGTQPVYANIFHFWWNENITEIVIPKDNFDTDEKIIMHVDGADKKNITVEVKDPAGHSIEIDTRLSNSSDGTVVTLLPPETITPGKYTVEVKNKKGTVLNTSFSWGVLAINVNQAHYRPNDEAQLSFAVLDEKGDMVCDADLELQIIQKATGIIDTLTTKDGDITTNPECAIYGVTYNPDYEATYTVGTPGQYTMELTATTTNGTYTVTDYFEVAETLDFIVERQTATRIYPVVSYPVEIRIIPNNDFKGQIIETVPNTFTIEKTETAALQPNLITDSSSTEKQLLWNVDLQKGVEYTLAYTYDAPDISPELFSIGPLQILDTTSDKIFSEKRKWKIAVDAVAFDAVTTDSASVGRSSASFSHTTTGSDRLLLVFVSLFHGNATPDVTSITYNGVSMTLETELEVVSSRHIRTFVYSLVNPASGSNTVAVTYAQSTQVADAVMAISYTGVDQTTPIPTTATNSSTSAADPTIDITTTTANSLIVAGATVRGGDTAPFTPGTGSTERWDFVTDTNANVDLGTWGGEESAATTGTYTVDATATNSDFYSMVAVEVAEVAAAGGITVSGNAYQSGTTALTDCDGTTQNIALRAGSTTYTTTCNASTGAWSIGSVTQPSSGDGLVVWIDGETTDGALVTRYDGTGDSTGNIFYANALTFTSDDSTAVNNADADTYDNADDADIPYTVSTNALTLNSGHELLVYTGKTYDPNGTVTTNATGGNLHVDDSSTAYLDTATSTIGADVIVDNGATLNIDATTNISGGDITLTGTGLVSTTTGTPTTTISGAGTIGGGTGSLTFYNLALAGTGTTTLNAPLTTANNLTIGDGTNAHTLDVETNDKAVDTNGAFTIAANGTYTASSTTDVTVQGNFTNGGILTEGTSTIVLDGSTTANLDSGCSTVSTCTTNNLYNLTLNKSTSGTTVTLLNTGLRVSNTLEITTGTLNQSTLDVQLEGSSALGVTSNGTWSNTSTGNLTLGGSVSINGTMTLQGNGASCGDTDSIVISSTSGGTQQTWNGTGTTTINDVTISDQSGTMLINALSSTNAGNVNTNWSIFGGCSTTPDPNELLRHGEWFSGEVNQKFSF